MENGKKGKKHYTAEFKAEAVRLVVSGEQKQAEVSRNLGVGSSTLSKWVSEAVGVGEPAACKEESARVKQLESELKRLKLEHEILKKAAAFFAKNQM